MKPERADQVRVPEYVDGLPLADIIQAVKSVRFGDVRIVVQDSKVVQIDKTEKTRFGR